MHTTLLVISDLHLGGAPAQGDKPPFQMCTERGRAELARFIRWAARRRTQERDVHLVIAGDIVDFLAEERAGGFQAFTNDDRVAAEKLRIILDDTKAIWQELRAFLQAGGALTLLLGNHDLELSLPAPRRLLLDTLGPGRVEFIYDNQAFTFGRVLVEHGNRYDDWNAVPHDDLREARSRLSRGETVAFDPLPGSRMVVDLVNPTKQVLSFVDLLKPEDAALLPFLALLSPNRFKSVYFTLANRVRASRVRYAPGQQPVDRNFVLSPTAGTGAPQDPLSTGDAADDLLVALANRAAAGGDAAMTAAGEPASFFDRWKAKLADAYRDKQLDLLLETLRAHRGSTDRAFSVEIEKPTYLDAAIETAARGYDVVVNGHTHLPKLVPLGGKTSGKGTAGRAGAVYLNSGTWADLMAVPRSILDGDRALLRSFTDDLANNRLQAWRRQLPTFVRVEVDGSGQVEGSAALETLGEGDTPVAVTTDLVAKTLG